MIAARLERALSLWLQHESTGGDPEALLAAHHDLRDLLEPLVRSSASPSGVEARRLGDFELLREVGRGGMGVVWEARQCSLDRRVAVKLVAPELTSSATAIARLRREAATAARLNHPNLVRVLGFGSEGAIHFLAMDFVDGEAIDAVERSDRETVALVAQVADALECVHGAGVVHRDVKPANVLVTASGAAVLTDFGLARDERGPSWSLSGTFAGTPQYSSPEQLRGGQVDAASDVFSLGVTLFELLTRTRPYPGSTPAAVIEAISRARIAPDLRAVRSDLPRDLAAILRVAIAPDRAERYATAAAFGADLRAWLDGRPVAARPPALVLRLARWARREPALASLVAVLAVGVPLVGGLVGHGIATRPLVRAGEALERRERIEHHLADAYLALSIGDGPRAITAIDAALKVDPDHREARVIRAVAAGETPVANAMTPVEHDAEQAFLATLSEAVGRLANARQQALRASAEELGDARAARLALPAVSVAARLAPSLRLPLYALLGSTAGFAGSAPTAKEAAQVLALHWPHSFAARRARARAMRAFDPEGAAIEYRRLVDEEPDDLQLRFELVNALCRQGDKPGAADASAGVVRLAPNDPMAHICLAEHLLESGRTSEAIPEYRHALALGAGDGLTHYNLGVALMESGRGDEASAEFRTAAALDPTSARPWANLAYLANERKDHAAALEASLRAVELGPALDPASVNLRQASIALARYDVTALELERWARRLATNVDAYREAATFLLAHPSVERAGERALRAALLAYAHSHGADAESVRLCSEAWDAVGMPAAARHFPLQKGEESGR